MRTRIPKLIAEINTIIADHSHCDSEEEQEAIELLKRARHKLGLAGPSCKRLTRRSIGWQLVSEPPGRVLSCGSGVGGNHLA
jgi:hypothetical protein